jgi:hypothetical protein
VYHDKCKLTGEEVADHMSCDRWEMDLTIDNEKLNERLKKWFKERSEKDENGRI